MHPVTIDPLPRSPRDWYVAVALAALAFAVFAPALDYGFVTLDDPYYVFQNPHVLSGLDIDSVQWAFTTFEQSNWHPLTWLSLQLDVTLWGTTARGFHATNVLLHAANVALVFLVLRVLTGAFWTSAAAALLFAVHPLRVESVAWVTERKDVLSVFFGLLALWAWAGYVAAPSVRRYFLVVVALALSLLAKPMLVTLPFLLLVLDWWPLARVRAGRSLMDISGASPREAGIRVRTTEPGTIVGEGANNGIHPDASDGIPAAVQEEDAENHTDGKHSAGRAGESWLWLFTEKLPLFVLVAAAAAVTYQAQSVAVMALTKFPVKVRLENAAVSYVEYLSKTIWPLSLAVFYPHPGAAMSTWKAAGAVLLLAVLTAAAVALRRRAPYLLAGWLWYLGTLVPVIGFVQVGSQAMADRYTYFPQIGVLLALCWGVAALAREYSREALMAAAATAVALTVLTRGQLKIWGDSIDLWKHTIQAAGKSPTSLISLGRALEDQDRLEDAARYYEEALVLDPDSVLGQTCLGGALYKMGRSDEAIPHLKTACSMDPSSVLTHCCLGNVYLQQGKLAEAVSEEEEAIRLAPEYSPAHFSLGRVEAARGNLDRAADCYGEALRLWPNFAEAHSALGALYLARGDTEKAVRRLSLAVRCNPRLWEPYLTLGKALEARGDHERAAGYFEQAVHLNPKSAEAWFHFGMALARHGHADEAETSLEEALQLAPGSPICQLGLAQILDGLAASQASEGNPAQAAVTARRARDLATAAGKPEFVRMIEEQLQRYERGETVRPAPGKAP
jgi:protein O-mannosyl-transferase